MTLDQEKTLCKRMATKIVQEPEINLQPFSQGRPANLYKFKRGLPLK